MTKIQLNYFNIPHKKAANLEKMYLLSKIYKILFYARGHQL